MARVLRIALGARELDAERSSELRRIFGDDVTVETISSPQASVIIERVRSFDFDAVVFEIASPDTVREVQSALPQTPVLGAQRKEVQTERDIGINERGQRVKGTRSQVRFESYGRRNDRGELMPLRDGELKDEIEQRRARQRDEQQHHGYEY